jgi:hypothetical protein
MRSADPSNTRADFVAARMHVAAPVPELFQPPLHRVVRPMPASSSRPPDDGECSLAVSLCRSNPGRSASPKGCYAR